MSNWYRSSLDDLIKQLATDSIAGLSDLEAKRRLAQYGLNELIEKAAKNPWLILWEQFTAIMVLILIAAAVISALLGDYKDALAILAVVILNAILGFSQEYRAEKAMMALRKLAVPAVRIKRSGRVYEISAKELVPGDLVILEAGNLLPADCRLIESASLHVQEAALTGESQPVEKDAQWQTKDELPLADRRNMAYMGTFVTYGRALAVVVETGMQTELGTIAALIQNVAREVTPLQFKLAQMSNRLLIAILALVSLIFLLGMLKGEPLSLMLMTAVSMAVAAIPEALPAVVTITLALGAQRMLKRQALIRKLPAVETLGAVTVICSDKTGTLTENRMTVTVLDVAGDKIDLMSAACEDNSLNNRDNRSQFPIKDRSALALLLINGALCNDAVLSSEDNSTSQPAVVGDPTEGALVIAAAEHGINKNYLDRRLPRVAELPFDSERKRMMTIHQLPCEALTDMAAPLALLIPDPVSKKTGYIAFVKGAVDSLLSVSSHIWIDNKVVPLTAEWMNRIIRSQDEMSQSGRRILGMAFRLLATAPAMPVTAEIEQDLVFVGMVGMVDPPRAEVKAAVSACKAAGIRAVMITGDHPLTARFIAQELGIATNNNILTGQQLSLISDEQLIEAVEDTAIYARVAPEHKLKIIEALQKRGEIVAMTGDGINDAPALKKADIGVAMGITGTDVAKEASDMVLLNDNFATIVAAVEEGRVIYDNIRKYIKECLAGNAGVILATLTTPLLGMPLPLLPLQILWVNLVADGPPSVALGVEPAERDTMKQPPRRPDENIFNAGILRQIGWMGIFIGAILTVVGYWYWQAADPAWQTMVFTTLIFARMAVIFAVRSWKDSLFTIGIMSNKPLLLAVLVTIWLQLAIIYLPFMQSVFSTVPLAAADLLISLLLGIVVFLAIEIEKWLIRRKDNRRPLNCQGQALPV